jgi:CBS domain-containing protein
MHSQVKDLLTTEVVTVGPATPFKEIVARLAEQRVSAVPMVDDAGLVRRSLIPWLVRAVRGVEGVVQIEDRLTYDLDDRDAGRVMASAWMRP